MKKKSLLREYLGKLTKAKKPKSAKTFDGYIKSMGKDIKADIDSALKNAYTEYKLGGIGHGAVADGIHAHGLARSGYAEYLQKRQDTAYSQALGDISRQGASLFADSIGAYERYLDEYIKDTGKLKQSVGNKLRNSSVIDRREAYKYAIDAGLSEEDARDVSDGAYSAVLKKLRAKILEQVLYYKIDSEMAAELARSYGLEEGDVERIWKEAKSITSKKNAYSESYLKELEKKADKTTSTY